MNIVATFAKPLTRLMAIAGRGHTAPAPSPATFGHATNATPWLRPAGVSLQVRAHRIHNRNAKAAAIYLRKHLILSKGACSDDQTTE